MLTCSSVVLLYCIHQRAIKSGVQRLVTLKHTAIVSCPTNQECSGLLPSGTHTQQRPVDVR